MKPLVSILVPAYNSERWIGGAIGSAIAQTWDHKEIVIVDDGSTDRTLEIARSFESSEVRVVTQQNQGAAAARNTAFSLSQGDYIQWLDADDLLDAHKIALQMAEVESCEPKHTLFSSAWGQFLSRPDRARFVPTALWCDLSPVEWLTRKMSQNLHMQTGTWLVSRELTEAAGPWNTQLLGDDDGEYFCRVLLASSGVRFVPEAKVFYRASGSASLSYIGRSDRKLEAQWRSMRLHIGYLRSLEDSPAVRQACLQYLQNWLLYFFPGKPEIVAQARAMARDLGGELETPHLSWKYAWLQTLFGWSFAKRAQVALPNMRWSFQRWRDRLI